jgi:hypothetical protein
MTAPWERQNKTISATPSCAGATGVSSVQGDGGGTFLIEGDLAFITNTPEFCRLLAIPQRLEENEALPPVSITFPPLVEDLATTEPADETERALAGIVLCPFNESALEAIAAAGLQEGDFQTATGRVVLAALDLHSKGRPVDLLTVNKAMTPETLERLGGCFALNRLVDNAPPVSHAGYYIRQVQDAAAMRRIAGLASGWVNAARNGTPAAKVLEFIRQGLDAEERREVEGSDTDLDGFSLATLAETEVDEGATLLGGDGIRYLCRGGTMLFVGPSGVGKSTASAQQDILWSLGRPAFGIAPARPLRIVTVQAENDQGDLIHMARGIIGALNLGGDDRAMVEAGTVYLSHNASTGPDFLAFVDRVVRRYKPDLVRIDPLMAYAGGDLTKPETIAGFCRNGLNRIATRHGVGIVVCHHTPKMTGNTANSQARKQWGAFDWQYAASGGADLANWARAMLVIESLSRDVFAFRAAKRWPGWRDDAGEAQHVRYFKRGADHSKPFWHDATPEDVAEAGTQSGNGAKAGPDLEAMEYQAVALVKTPTSPRVFKELLQSKLGLGKGKAETMLAMLTADGGPLIEWKGKGWQPKRFVGTPAMKQQWENPQL